MLPFFSIVVPVYNRASLILKLINNVNNQTFKLFELIIVDDGSTDNTQSTVAPYLSSTIKYVRTPNQERSCARNTGMRLAVGTYINFFDSDDEMFPDRLNTVFQFIKDHNEPDIIFTHYNFVNEDGETVGEMKRYYSSFTKDLLYNNFLATGSVFLKTSIAHQNLFHEDRRIITAEDWELWLRIHINYKFVECRKKTFSIVTHDNRSLNTISSERIEERDLYFVSLVNDNESFRIKYQRSLDLFMADRYTFIALTMVSQRHRVKTAKYLYLAIKMSIFVIRRKRFWAVSKKLIFRN